jgi:hypothetical protein
VQDLPEYKEEKLDLEIIDGKKSNKEMTTGFVTFKLACKDVNMMALARDAVEPLVRGRNTVLLIVIKVSVEQKLNGGKKVL